MAAPSPRAEVAERLSKIAKGEKIVVATHNSGKLREIRDLLEPFDVQILGVAEIGIPEPEETGTTFAANAEFKARAAARVSGLTALADDSGLEVRALGNAPGIYSARWAGPDRDFCAAMRRVEGELAEHDDRSARFVAALALCRPNDLPDGAPQNELVCETFTGEVKGRLVFPPRGDRGFGYDAIFVPDGHRITFGEMEPARKHAMSHRAVAFRRLVDHCFAGVEASDY